MSLGLSDISEQPGCSLESLGEAFDYEIIIGSCHQDDMTESRTQRFFVTV